MNRILYRPNLGIQKRYETDGNVEPLKEYQPIPVEEQKVEHLIDVANQILAIKEVSTQLPNEMQSVINTMINTLEFIFVQIDPEYIPGEKDENGNTTDEDADISISKPTDEETKVPDEDKWLYSDVVPNIVIKTIPQDKIKLINKVYCGTLLEITKDYISTLKSTTTQYFMDIGMLMLDHKDTGLPFVEKRYTYKTTDIKNKNLHHVSDFIIKSQIIRNQKQRMMNKLINEHESINKITACELARELSIRYEKEQLKANNTYEDLFNNMSLKESRLQYEQKMDNNLYELYKYLNSSVILLDECLRLYIREAQAKSILIKEEGIKL